MDNNKGADQRRNVFDIVADLGFLDPKPLRRAAPPAPAEAPAPDEPAATEPPSPPPELARPLTEAQQRAAQQRIAAERLLHEALELERTLAEERDAAEHAAVCTKNLEAARTEASAASEALAARRAEREETEARLREIREGAVAAPPFGGLSALEALAQFEVRESPAEAAAPPPRPRTGARVALAAASAAVLAIAAIALLRPTAAHQPAANVVHVCTSSLTAQFAAGVVNAYADKTRVSRALFDLSGRGPCDVRFSTKRIATDDDLPVPHRIAVLRNPHDGLTRTAEGDVRLAVIVTQTSRGAGAAGLVAFARSANAHATVARAGFVPN